MIGMMLASSVGVEKMKRQYDVAFWWLGLGRRVRGQHEHESRGIPVEEETGSFLCLLIYRAHLWKAADGDGYCASGRTGRDGYRRVEATFGVSAWVWSEVLASIFCIIRMILSLGSSMSKRRKLEERSRPFMCMKLDYFGIQIWVDLD